MKHIVFLVGEYQPFASPNGNIADNIIQELKSKYKITVITRKNKFGLENECIIDGIRILRIPDYNISIHNLCLEKMSRDNSFFERLLFAFLLQVKRGFFFAPRLIRRQSISLSFAKKIERQIEKLNDEDKIDILIPVSAPHEEVYAGIKFKKNHKSNCKLLVYQLDRFANANSLYETKFGKSYKFRNNINMEIEYLKTCDYLFILPPLLSHYQQKFFNAFMDKIIVTEHPLVKKNYESQQNNKHDVNFIEVLYAGSLDIKLRNPTYLLKIFSSNVLAQTNIKLSLYSFGNCQKIIGQYEKKFQNKINNYGRIPKKEIIEKMAKCDVLLTIGNNSDNEVPSKLFEYLSYCKPIIHLYYSEKDAYLEYLKPYTYSLCIKMDDNLIGENSELFSSFCIKYRLLDISYEKVRDIYRECTPEFVAEQFINIIECNRSN